MNLGGLRAIVRTFAATGIAVTPPLLLAQGSALTLEQAIEMAKNRNGVVRAAVLDVQASRSRVRQSFSSFLPVVSPSYRFQNSRSETYTGPAQTLSKSNDHISSLSASWRLLDTGERELSYRASRRSASAQEASSRQILRNVLFAVHQQFFDTLRSEELRKVADAQVKRTEELYKQTEVQIQVKVAPEKDLKQARADLLNARVSQLQAENQVSTTSATLKATIGWDRDEALPELQPIAEPQEFPKLPALESVIAEGVANRPDLVASRLRVQAQEFDVKLADRNSSVQLSVDANYVRDFSPDVFDSRTLTVLLTYPLFDGFASREAAREARLSLEASRNSLVQAEREARAEIESAYKLLEQDTLRVQAAKAAYDAALENYRAAAEAHRLGAEGTTVITVLTAQVSLVTAESNFVEALFDFRISEVRLSLVTGRLLPGEP